MPEVRLEYVKIKGSQKLISGIIDILIQMNQDPKYHFEYSTEESDSSVIAKITALDKEDFIDLVFETFKILKPDLKIELTKQVLKK
ncbi:MAG: hypothetical protein ACJ748_01630 [Flavisolibacter sp.]